MGNSRSNIAIACSYKFSDGTGPSLISILASGKANKSTGAKANIGFSQCVALYALRLLGEAKPKKHYTAEQKNGSSLTRKQGRSIEWMSN